MKPSPGPWKWDDDFDEGYVLWDATGNLVLATYEAIGHADSQTAERKDLRALVAAAPEMREMLLKLEWSGNQSLACCPKCERRPPSKYDKVPSLGHAHDCALAALLDRIR